MYGIFRTGRNRKADRLKIDDKPAAGEYQQNGRYDKQQVSKKISNFILNENFLFIVLAVQTLVEAAVTRHILIHIIV